MMKLRIIVLTDLTTFPDDAVTRKISTVLYMFYAIFYFYITFQEPVCYQCTLRYRIFNLLDQILI